MANTDASFYKSQITDSKYIDVSIRAMETADAIDNMLIICAKNAVVDNRWKIANDLISLHLDLVNAINEWKEANKEEESEEESMNIHVSEVLL